MSTFVKRLVLLNVLAAACLSPARAAAQPQTVSVTRGGDHFQVDYGDGTGPHAKFLVLISYFDGMRAGSGLTADLDYLKTLGFDGIRVLPNWQRRGNNYCAEETTGDRLMNATGNLEGNPSDPPGADPTGPLGTFLNLVKAAKDRGLVVDVTFTAETYSPEMNVQDANVRTNYVNAVKRVAKWLSYKGYHNVLFDLQNEVDIKTIFTTPAIGEMRAAISEVDPSFIQTVSKFIPQGGTYQDVINYHTSIGTSAIAYHGSRESTWPTDVTGEVTGLRPSGKPVYMQEPQAWNSGLIICAGDPPGNTGIEGGPGGRQADGYPNSNPNNFRNALSNARTAGAAAWTFHTRQGFKLDSNGPDGVRWIKDRIDLPANAGEKAMLNGTGYPQKLTDLGHSGPWGISQVTLLVSLSGTGHGTVTSVPGGISCGNGGACTFTFPVGTTDIALTATPDAGSAFLGWTGDACSGTGTCRVTASSAMTATFGTTGPHLGRALDLPANGQLVAGRFQVGGWAVDENAATGTGVTGVTVTATRVGGGSTSLGPAAYGSSRPDVAALYNRPSFQFSGFNLLAFPPASGDYDVTAVAQFANGSTASFLPITRRITVKPRADLARAGDFDSDFLSEMTVYNTTSGAWSWLTSSSSYTAATNMSWGGSGYTAAPGDYDGDGKADLGVYHQSSANWYVLLSGSNFTTSMSKNNGGPGWIPVPGDYDGDGKTDFAAYNTTTGVWFGLKSSSDYTTSFNVTNGGGPAWKAVPADFDGDGKTDIGVYETATGRWSVLFSSTNYTAGLSIYSGGSGWVPVPADYDGDGKADLAVYNTTTGVWFGLKSSTTYTTSFNISWGGAGYTPVRGDYDGDGKADLATYFVSSGGNATWYILLSGANYTTSLSRSLGGSGWVPVPQSPQ